MSDEKMRRPEDFEFAMDFLGGSEAESVGQYVERLETEVERWRKAAQRQGGEAVAWMDGISGNVTTNPDPEHLTDTDLYIPLYAEPPLQPAAPESLDRELVETLDYLMGQVDPVCWPNRRMAREAHQKIRALMKRPKPPEDV